MSGFKEKCVEYFGTSDLYEILSIERDASTKESKCYDDIEIIFCML